MSLKRFLRWLRLRQMERRGEAVINAEAFWDSIRTLAEDLIPGPDDEISRDLFAILAFWWATRAEKGVYHDPFQILRDLHDKAWLAYCDMPTVVGSVCKEFPSSVSRQRLLNYFEELHAKCGTYLFLPIVSRIERHQSAPLPSTLQLDGLMDEFGDYPDGSLVRLAFAAAPRKAQERNVFLLALLTRNWGRTQVFDDPMVLNKAVAAQLRLLYCQPDRALAAVRKDAATDRQAACLANVADELTNAVARPLFLETLFITENWITGPQHFEHAFEIERAGPDLPHS